MQHSGPDVPICFGGSATFARSSSRGIAELEAPSPFSVLNLSIGTVKGYVRAIFEKLGVEDRTQAALLVAKHDR